MNLTPLLFHTLSNDTFYAVINVMNFNCSCQEYFLYAVCYCDDVFFVPMLASLREQYFNELVFTYQLPLLVMWQFLSLAGEVTMH